ncbi:membrane protein [Clostridioides difficile]|nr:membrane protein [Clostridioides difficile]VIM43149.1 membrane protein [Clostridioides difficile]
MNTLFSNPGSILAVMTSMIALGFYLQRYKAIKSLGPALTIIIMGIILSNLKVVPVSTELYGTISTYAIPVSMTIMLMSVDLKEMTKLSREPLIAIFVAVLTVSIMAFLFGLVFAEKISEGWKVAGMFVGTYTGGSANLTAIGTGLNVSRQTLAAANAADYVIGVPTLIFMFALPAILKNSKKFKKLWPYHVEETELEDCQNEEFMESKEWSIKDIAWMLAIGFVVTEVSTILAGYFNSSFSSAARILLVTTISIIIAQLKPVKKLKGNLDLGLFVALFFLCTIGFSVDIKEFLGSTFTITLYCFSIIFASFVFHLGITRLLKIKYQYVILSIVGAIADGPTSALVAASAKWNSLVSVAVVMGVIGGVLGNYAGISVAYAIKMSLVL